MCIRDRYEPSLLLLRPPPPLPGSSLATWTCTPSRLVPAPPTSPLNPDTTLFGRIDLLIAIMNEQPEQRAAIAEAGAIPVLVQTILPASHVRASTLGAAAEALRCLTHDNPPNRTAVAHAGGLAPLLALAHMDDSGCQKYAAAALGNLVFKRLRHGPKWARLGLAGP